LSRQKLASRDNDLCKDSTYAFQKCYKCAFIISCIIYLFIY